MSLKKRLMAVGFVVIITALAFVVAGSGVPISEKQQESLLSNGKDTLYLWYTDEALTSYLSSAAVIYNENHDVRIVPVLESGLEYLEKINQNSIESNAPDLYVISHDSLEKAYLAGLASEVEPTDRMLMNEAFINTGLQAATYKDKLIGYPFYFETTSFLYNKTYLNDMAKSQLQAEADLAAAEAAQEALEENGPETEDTELNEEAPAATATPTPVEEESPFTPEQIEAKTQELLPSTIDEIRSFADSYDAPEQVEGVFKWDVTDIFYNYFFVGNAINMGGEAGWDTSQIDIYNIDAIKSMRVYQDLNQFFSIDTSESDYDAILDEFMSGKMVFTVATTDAIFQLEQAKSDELFAYDYGVIPLPDITDEIPTRSLSVTNCVVINGYSSYQKEANDFAGFLTAEYNDILFARTGKVSAAKNVDYGYEALNEFALEYESSISMPKMIETSNFWVQLEAAFSDIWEGADPNDKLRDLSQQIMQQVTGNIYIEERIKEEIEEEDVEFLDEEFYKQEAMDDPMDE